MKTIPIPVVVPVTAIVLAIPFASVVALPFSSVDGSANIYGELSYLDPGATSNTTAASISFNNGVVSYTAWAGGGSITGGAHPFISISTYARNNGVWQTSGWANATTFSSIYVGAKPGFSPLEPGTPVPIKLDCTSTLMEEFGGIFYEGNIPEPYNMAFYLGDVFWHGYNTSSTLSGNVGYGSLRDIGIYTSMGSKTEYVFQAGGWAKADLTATITPYVDADWNAAHGNGYQVFYVVPEPATYALVLGILVGLAVFIFQGRQHKRLQPGSPTRRT